MRGGLWTLGRWEEERKKISFTKVRVVVREFLSLSINYQCLSLWQLLCQALPVLFSPGLDHSCGSDPSSGLTSLVHHWLVIGGGTAGPEASRTAKCFCQYKNKTQFFKKKQQKKRETHAFSYFCSSRCSLNLIFFTGFANHSLFLSSFQESFCVIKWLLSLTLAVSTLQLEQSRRGPRLEVVRL